MVSQIVNISYGYLYDNYPVLSFTYIFLVFWYFKKGISQNWCEIFKLLFLKMLYLQIDFK